MRTVVIINPVAGGGRARRLWPKVEAALRHAIGPFDTAFTTPQMGSEAIAKHATQGGYQRVIAAGGDGTVNETVNGLYGGMEGAASGIHLGILPLGTGNDLARGVGIPTVHHALQAIAKGQTRVIDLGRVSCTRSDSTSVTRLFANVASLGLIGEVVQAAESAGLKRLLGSKLAYPLHAAQVLWRYRGHEIEFETEDGSVKRLHMLAAAMANGRFFGAGMKVAPHAVLDDGLLDVLVAENKPKFGVTDLRLLYSGRHIDHPAIRHFKARRLRIAAVDGSRMLCETDGELQGHGPCEVEVMPAALRVIG